MKTHVIYKQAAFSFGLDRNGNRVVRVIPILYSKTFGNCISIQTNGVIQEPDFNDKNHAEKLFNEVKEYIERYGTANQREKLDFLITGNRPKIIVHKRRRKRVTW